jgi:hypothetical protein
VGGNGWGILAGGQGFAACRFGDRRATGFYLKTGAGVYNDGGEGQPRFFLGGGVDIPLRSVDLFVEVRRAFWSSVSTMWLTGGVSISLGGGR